MNVKSASERWARSVFIIFFARVYSALKLRWGNWRCCEWNKDIKITRCADYNNKVLNTHRAKFRIDCVYAVESTLQDPEWNMKTRTNFKERLYHPSLKFLNQRTKNAKYFNSMSLAKRQVDYVFRFGLRLTRYEASMFMLQVNVTYYHSMLLFFGLHHGYFCKHATNYWGIFVIYYLPLSRYNKSSKLYYNFSAC